MTTAAVFEIQALQKSLARRLLMTLHSIDISPGASLGPGLVLVHPFGVTIGYATLGRNIALFQNATIGAGSYIDHDVQPGTVVAGGRPSIEPFESSAPRQTF